jgi:hypothetical protein
MPAKSSRPGNEKTLKSEIEAKRGEIRRLQDKFASDSERHKYLVTYQDRLLKYIQDLNAQNAQTQERYDMEKKMELEEMSRIENSIHANEIASRARISVALAERLATYNEVQAASLKLSRFEEFVQDRTRFYRETLAKRKAEVDEARRDLEVVEQQNARLMRALISDHPEQFGFSCSLESPPEDDVDEFRGMEPMALRLQALRAEDEKLTQRITLFRQLKERLQLQIQALNGEE